MTLLQKISSIVNLVFLLGMIALDVWSLFLGPNFGMLLVCLCFTAGFGYFAYTDYKKLK